MSEQIITIHDGVASRQAELSPKGMIIGRSPSCGLVLPSGQVSRQHARISQDPFGRWVIEDLGSKNGVLINDQAVQSHALAAGDTIVIGNYTLKLGAPEASGGETITNTVAPMLEDLAQTQVVLRTSEQHAQSSIRIKNLNRITDSLQAVTGESDLYPEVCRLLAQTPDSIGLVLRVPRQGDFAAPQMLACCVSGFETSRTDPPQAPHNLHVSRRVVEAVRSTGNAAMAGNITEAQLALTMCDDRRPRAVFCAAVSEGESQIDLLYLDSPADASTAETLDLVQAIARQVNMARKGLLLADERASRKVLDRQLALAHEIQAKLTPQALVGDEGVEVAVHYEPAMWVGGDYCDVWALGAGRLALAVGDVSGKGLPAAMIMTNLQAALRTTMAFCSDLPEVMIRLSQHLEMHLPEGLFVTMLLGVYDSATRRLDYVNAGHILPFLRTAGGAATQIGQPSNPPLGIAPAPYQADSVTLKAGEAFLAVTDGITESASPSGDMLGEEALSSAITRCHAADGPQLVKVVTEIASDFRQSMPQQDDITVLALLAK